MIYVVFESNILIYYSFLNYIRFCMIELTSNRYHTNCTFVFCYSTVVHAVRVLMLRFCLRIFVIIAGVKKNFFASEFQNFPAKCSKVRVPRRSGY